MTLATIFTAVLAVTLAAPGRCLFPVPGVKWFLGPVAEPTPEPDRANGHVHGVQYFRARAKALSTFTKSYPKPTQTLGCDSNTLGKVLRTHNGIAWLINCNFDFPGNDFAQLHVNALAECMEACSVDDRCKAFAYNPAITTMNCFLKTAGDPHTWDTGTGMQIGWQPYLTGTPVPSSTAPLTPTSSTPLRTVAITPLPTPSIPFNPSMHNHYYFCYHCGDYTERLPALLAIDLFCQGGVNRDFGGYYPDRLLFGGDSISLAWGLTPGFTIYLNVNVKEGCMIDFASLEDGTCKDLFVNGIVDNCNRNSENYKQGGYLDDDCAHWVFDVNPADHITWDGCTGGDDDMYRGCHTWRKYVYDGPNDDVVGCPSGEGGADDDDNDLGPGSIFIPRGDSA